MQNPENYNLDIGPEHEGHEKIVFTDRRHLKAISTAVFVSLGLVFISLLYIFLSTNSKLAERDSYITSLIDEVGQLKRDRFVLSEQVKSQGGVLDSIAEDFSSIETILSGGNSSANSLKELLSGAKQAFAKKSTLALNDEVIMASEDETFDVLILGTNGNLTDTIMLASVNDRLKKVTLFSVPRDLYTNGRRINEYLYYYGIEQLERMIASITGLTVDKYVKVDFEGFVSVVDILDGVDIYVDEAIYDSYYPNAKGAYTPYSIDVGTYHMSGEEALKYARSRKSTSDFDRAARQQKIVQAVRSKLLQLNDLGDLKRMAQIIQSAMSNTVTDINILEAISYYYDYKDYEFSTGFVLSTQNYLYSILNESGAYILLPKSGNFDEIKKALSSLVTH